MVKIAFGFQARVGKDTAGAYLAQKEGGVTVAFAKPLHDILKYAQDRLGLACVKDRAFLQTIGDWGKTKDEMIFVKIALSRASENKDVFVTDTRYPNEFEALQTAGFYMVRIVRRAARASEDFVVARHSSEHSLYTAPWDEIIENDGSLDDFYQKLDVLYGKIKSSPPI